MFEINVLDGHLFLFINKRRDRIKAMWWDRDGLVLFKNMQEATRIPKDLDACQTLILEQARALLDMRKRSCRNSRSAAKSPKRRSHAMSSFRLIWNVTAPMMCCRSSTDF